MSTETELKKLREQMHEQEQFDLWMKALRAFMWLAIAWYILSMITSCPIQ